MLISQLLCKRQWAVCRQTRLLVQVPCDMGAFYAMGPNPHVLEGALVSGPAFDNDAYQDQRTLVNSRVALDYNAGFTGAPTYLFPALLS